MKSKKHLIPVANGDLNDFAPVTIPVLVTPDELAAYLARVPDAQATLTHVHAIYSRIIKQAQNLPHN